MVEQQLLKQSQNTEYVNGKFKALWKMGLCVCLCVGGGEA